MEEVAVARTACAVFLFHLSPPSLLHLLLWPHSQWPPCFVSASFPLFPFSFTNCCPAQQVESFLSFFQNGEKQNDTSLVCRRTFFNPTSNNLFSPVFVFLAILDMLYARPFFCTCYLFGIYLVFHQKKCTLWLRPK